MTSNLPEAPKPFAVVVAASERYDFHKTTHDFVPQVSLEYKPTQQLRFSVGVSRSTDSGDYSITGAVSVKILRFGKGK